MEGIHYNLGPLQGKRVFIAGASKGIGFALAELLDAQGATLLLHASSESGIARLRDRFPNHNHHLWRCDFSNPDQIEVQLIPNLDQFGPIDGFVFCVGMRVRRAINLLSTQLIQQGFNTNVVSFFELVRLITKRNRFNLGLSIVSISSVAAFQGSAGISVYAATKGAIESATKSLARELHKKGIRVNTIVCGQVNTEAYADYLANNVSLEDKALDRQYLGLIEPKKIATACLFLLGDASSYMSGASFPADGGYLT